MRIVSLLPAATEIVGALGLLDDLVGVSHECDFPAQVGALPRVTRCPIHGAGLSSEEIDEWVRRSLAENGTLYTLDEPLLRDLRPDVVLTQKLCDVCAVGYGSVARMAAHLPSRPRIVNLEPSCLQDVWDDIRRVADACGVPERGARVTANLQKRVAAVNERVGGISHPPRCVLLEWVAPPFCGGHWMPEIIRLAGGLDPLGRQGQPSARIEWQRVVAAQPDALLLSLCGYGIERARQDLPLLQAMPGWTELPAARHNRVFIADANAYFSRPGPRLADAVEMTAGALHPDIFPEFAPCSDIPSRMVRVEVATPATAP